jgi:hypothetical protein
MRTAICKGPASATKSRQTGPNHANIISRAEQAAWPAIAFTRSKEADQ